jgi:hypothetical protein
MKQCAYVGKKVQLVYTDDQYTKLKPGDFGVVRLVDDTGTIHVNWEDGSNLGLIPGVDKFHIITV